MASYCWCNRSRWRWVSRSLIRASCWVLFPIPFTRGGSLGKLFVAGVHRQQGSAQALASARQGRLDAGIAGADHDDVKIISERNLGHDCDPGCVKKLILSQAARSWQGAPTVACVSALRLAL